MNIFYLSQDPIQSAQWMVDKHVVKMILESAQLLSTAHRVIDGEEIIITPEYDPYRTKQARKKKWYKLYDQRESVLYSATHINHPSAIWARKSVENYNWLVEHFFALMQEYTHRYGKVHKCNGDLSYYLQSPPNGLKDYDWTTIPCAMDEAYIISTDPVVNYQNYYKRGKVDLHKWTNREKPEWI